MFCRDPDLDVDRRQLVDKMNENVGDLKQLLALTNYKNVAKLEAFPKLDETF